MGDIQGIEFIDGLEYVTNIINDRVIPDVLFPSIHYIVPL